MEVDYALAIGLARIEATADARAEELRTALAAAGFRVRDAGAARGAIVTFETDADPEEVRRG